MQRRAIVASALLAVLAGCGGGAAGGGSAPTPPSPPSSASAAASPPATSSATAGADSAAPAPSAAPTAAPTAAPDGPPAPESPPVVDADKDKKDEAKPVEERKEERPKKAPSKMAVVTPTPTGEISQADIAAAVSDAEQLFEACRGVGASGAKPLVASITVKATLRADGSVDDASVQKSSTRNATADKCVTDAVRRLKFPAPKEGASRVILIPIELGASGTGR